eukprot:359555-Chlamydomonas_euryale.AAC.14
MYFPHHVLSAEVVAAAAMPRRQAGPHAATLAPMHSCTQWHEVCVCGRPDGSRHGLPATEPQGCSENLMNSGSKVERSTVRERAGYTCHATSSRPAAWHARRAMPCVPPGNQRLASATAGRGGREVESKP